MDKSSSEDESRSSMEMGIKGAYLFFVVPTNSVPFEWAGGETWPNESLAASNTNLFYLSSWEGATKASLTGTKLPPSRAIWSVSSQLPEIKNETRWRAVGGPSEPWQFASSRNDKDSLRPNNCLVNPETIRRDVQEELDVRPRSNHGSRNAGQPNEIHDSKVYPGYVI